MAQERLAELEALGEAGGAELLDAAAQSELRALEERLEDLSATLEFRNSTIGELRESIGQMGAEMGAELPATGPLGGGLPSTEQLDAQLKHMSLPVARRVLSANLSRLLELRHDQKAKARQLEAAELALGDKEAALAAAQAAARQAAADAERRLEHAHARHVRELIEQQRTVPALQAQLQLQPASATTRASHDKPPPHATPADSDAVEAAPMATGGGGGGGGGGGDVEAGALSPRSLSASQSATPGSRTPAEGRTPDSVASSAARSPSQQTLEALGKDNFYYKQVRDYH